MTDLLGSLTVADLGATALLSLTVLMVLTGRLVTRSREQDLIADRDAWRAAHQVSEEARHVQVRQIDELVEAGRTTRYLVETLHGVTSPERAT